METDLLQCVINTISLVSITLVGAFIIMVILGLLWVCLGEKGDEI